MRHTASKITMFGGVLLRIVLLTAGLVAAGVVVVGAMRKDGQAGAAAQTNGTLFDQFVVAGGPIVWFVLVPMSVVAVYLAVDCCLTIRRRKIVPTGAAADVLTIARQSGIEQLPARLAGRKDLVSVAVSGAICSARGDWSRVGELVAESLQGQAGVLVRRIEWLSLIGSVSPMVGLFGTIVGMIQLFNAIVAAGGYPHVVRLASGISVALVTTFWGLLIAIPAVAVHSVFRGKVEALVDQAYVQSELVVTELQRAVERRRSPVHPPVGMTAQPIREIAQRPSRGVGESLSAR